MTADSDQQTETETSKAIISSTGWSVLDFDDIEKSLTAKLSDEDVDNVLRSIGAVNNVKILKLGGCVNITGIGLDLLRSSVAIEQIDMSLVGKHEVPLIEPGPQLSADAVLPILHSIIIGGSSLKQEFPKKWRDTRSTQLDQFLERYNGYLISQRYCCLKCDLLCVDDEDEEEWICRLDGDEWHGTQNFTCTKCVNHFCGRAGCIFTNDNSTVNWCKECEKRYCENCTATYSCRRCEHEFCNECKEMKTCEGGCERAFCDDCSEKTTCCYCGKMRCSICAHRIPCSSNHCNKGVCSECVFNREREVGWDEARKCKCGGRLSGYA